MWNKDEMRGKTDQIKGAIEKEVGNLLDDDELSNEGEADEAAGEACKAYGAGNIMRMPGRLHITWQDDNTLKVETDTGMQTRLFHFGRQQAAAGAPDWQGVAIAQWEFAGGRGRGP